MFYDKVSGLGFRVWVWGLGFKVALNPSPGSCAPAQRAYVWKLPKVRPSPVGSSIQEVPWMRQP